MPVKKFLSALAVLCLVTTCLFADSSPKGYILDILESTDSYILCEVQFDSVFASQTKIGSSWYADISIKGFAQTDSINQPRLPVTSIILGIPSKSTPTLSIVSEKSTTRSLGEPVPVLSDSVFSIKEITQENVKLMPWFPAEIAQLGTSGFVRDQKIVQVELHPVRYSQKSHLTQIVESLCFRIDLNNTRSNGYTNLSVSKSLSVDRFEDYYKKNLANYETAKKWRSRPPKNTVQIQKAVAEEPPFQFKLSVEQDGVFAVTGEELIAAGADLESIDPLSLSLTNRGKPVPIIIEGEADGAFNEKDRIIFIGEHNKGDNTWLSMYSETNIYWLEWGGQSGARYAEISGLAEGAPSDTLTSARIRIHLEQDILYDRHVNTPSMSTDQWFWQALGGGDNYDFVLPIFHANEAGNVQIRANMRGLTHLSANPDHHVVFKLNYQELGDVIWNDQNDYEFLAPPVSYDVLEGKNIFSINLPQDLPGVEYDKVMLNWIEIDYDGDLLARNDSLAFYLEEANNSLVQLGLFTTPDVYILNNYGQRIKNFITIPDNNFFTVNFVNHVTSPVKYIVVAENELKKVKEIIEEEPSSLKDTGNSADYIIITHNDFMDAAQKLADYRSSEGFRTKVVDIEDVYDEFNFGLYDPRAIRAFLKYAYNNWSAPAPAYILLFGDTTHNMDKQIARDSDFQTFVPTMMENTVSWGMTASDNYFVAVVGDDPLPDMYIGRFPADTPEEAEIMVQKTIDYETKQLAEEWRRHVCLLAGNSQSYEQSAQFLYDHYLPKRFLADWVSTEFSSSHFGSTEDVARNINNGQCFLNFVGHGGGGVYFDSELFTEEDVVLLNNKDKYPVTFSMTCFVGHFDNPEMASLSEDLMKAEDKGIVAHFGSSGRAYLYGNYFLNYSVFRMIFEHGIQRLGEVVTLAKYDMILATNSYWDHVKNYILIGDPALALQLPLDIIELNLNKKSFDVGDHLLISGQIPGKTSGELTLSAFSENDSLLVQKSVTIENGTFSVDMLTLDSNKRKVWGTSGGQGLVRAYFTDGNENAASSTSFLINKPFVESVYPVPAKPQHMEPAFFVVNFDTTSLQTFGVLKSVDIEYSTNNKTWESLTLNEMSNGVFKSTSPLQWIEGSTVFYRVVATNQENHRITDVTNSFAIGYRGDLVVDAQSIRLDGSEDVRIWATINNIGDAKIGTFSINLYEGLVVDETKKIGTTRFIEQVDARCDTSIYFIWSNSSTGPTNVTFQVDQENSIEESNENNNITQKNIWLASAIKGTSGFMQLEQGNFAIDIPAAALSQNTLLDFDVIWNEEFLQSAQESNLTPIKTKNLDGYSALNVAFNDSSTMINKPITVAAIYDNADTTTQRYLSEQALRLYAWNSKSNIWHGLKSTIDTNSGMVTALLPTGYTTFALLASSDTEAPIISINVKGQNFADGDVVGQNPVFTFSIEDNSGFDFDLSPVTLYLDNNRVDENEVTLFHEAGTNRFMTATFIPELESGDFSLEITAMDLNGNEAEIQVHFSTGNDFLLRFIANHPNPFVERTTIVFSITDMAEEVKLGIYTVSGRLIRTFKYYDIIGYVEQDWDGCDEDGNQVANGVYYLKITARRDDKKIEKIEKMARLQ